MKRIFTAVLFVFSIGLVNAFAQDSPVRAETPPPPPRASATPKLSDTLALNLQQQTGEVSREKREQAYAKLLEGQRYIFNSKRQRSSSAMQSQCSGGKIGSD